MLATSTCVNCKGLSILCSLTTCCREPPKAIEDLTATLSPSAPHLFLEVLSEKSACIRKGDVECVNTTYCVGVIVKDWVLLLNLVTLPVMVMYGFVSMLASPSKGINL